MSKEKAKKDKSRKSQAMTSLMNSPFIELSSNREAVIEGGRGVLEYSSEVIRVNASDMTVSFFGRDLDLKCISDSALIIGGFIARIEFTV